MTYFSNGLPVENKLVTTYLQSIIYMPILYESKGGCEIVVRTNSPSEKMTWSQTAFFVASGTEFFSKFKNGFSKQREHQLQLVIPTQRDVNERQVRD